MVGMGKRAKLPLKHQILCNKAHHSGDAGTGHSRQHQQRTNQGQSPQGIHQTIELIQIAGADLGFHQTEQMEQQRQN